MKPLALLALLTLLIFPTISYAQNSQSEASPVDKNKVIANLLDRIDADEQLIKAHEERELALMAEIRKADEAKAELTEAHKLALIELGETRATIKFLKDEAGHLREQVALWKSEAERTKSELKQSRKRELILIGAIILRSIL